MIERMKAWQCIGCGRIEGAETCIGICQDRAVELVFAAEHEQALVDARREAETLRAVVRRLAWTTPHAGEWERSFRALQEQARRALAKERNAGT